MHIFKKLTTLSKLYIYWLYSFLLQCSYLDHKIVFISSVTLLNILTLFNDCKNYMLGPFIPNIVTNYMKKPGVRSTQISVLFYSISPSLLYPRDTSQNFSGCHSNHSLVTNEGENLAHSHSNLKISMWSSKIISCVTQWLLFSVSPKYTVNDVGIRQGLQLKLSEQCSPLT